MSPPVIAIDESVAEAAVETVLKALGTSLRHYMPETKKAAIVAMGAVLANERDRSAQIADEVCEDLVRSHAVGDIHLGAGMAAAAIRRGHGETIQ